MSLNFKGAAALAVALFFGGSFGYAQSSEVENKWSKSETYKDIIEKSYNLVLQKDRQQALNILSAALLKENRTQAIAELKKTFSDISATFFSDKAQQLYESGLSVRRSDLNQALDRMVEASRIEPDNFAILTEQARLMIAKNDCRGSFEILQKYIPIVKYDNDLRLTLAQIYVCQNKWLEFTRLYEGAGNKKSTQHKFWLVLEMDRLVTQKQYLKAQEVWSSLEKIDDKYPEAHYWGWRLKHAQKKSAAEEAQKYVMSCKNISANHYRQYMIDPMLCRHVSEVESELKGVFGNAEKF